MDARAQTLTASSATSNVTREIDCLLAVIERRDPRTADWLAEEPVRLALTKLLFFTTPAQYRELADPLRDALRRRFIESPTSRDACFDFLASWADSLNAPVELDHNLARKELHGARILSEAEIASERPRLVALLHELSQREPDVERRFLAERRNYSFSVNSAKGLNLFKCWAERWQQQKSEDPFASIEKYLEHRAALFAPGSYYVDLYFAFRQGRSISQFFNDYSEQADDCRKIGSLGGTTNPVIATFGEDDLPRKWGEARRRLAEQARTENRDAEWAATAFTELVVFNAQLAQRPVFLLEGLGRISFQLRTDKADDPDYLLDETPEIYARLCRRLEAADEILLDGADPLYAAQARERLGQSNNHFKVSVSGPAALRVLREFNAGNNRLGTRLYTNSTVTHDLSQIIAALDATLEGALQWEQRTGQRVLEREGHFGSVVTSMMGRYVDAMRGRRIDALLQALGTEHPLYAGLRAKVSGKNPLNAPPLNDPALVAALREKNLDFRPDSEEDAIRHLATLITKIAVLDAVKRYGPALGNRILSASKRFFQMNTDLENEHRFSTDFGDIQAESITASYRPVPEPLAGFDPETGQPLEDPNNVWWRRAQEIRRIFPDAQRHLTPGAIPPEDWMNQPYNQATMNDFTAKWWLNVDRARISAELLDGKFQGTDGQKQFAEKFYGHLGEKAPAKTWLWAQGFCSESELAALRWQPSAA